MFPSGTLPRGRHEDTLPSPRSESTDRGKLPSPPESPRPPQSGKAPSLLLPPGIWFCPAPGEKDFLPGRAPGISTPRKGQKETIYS